MWSAANGPRKWELTMAKRFSVPLVLLSAALGALVTLVFVNCRGEHRVPPDAQAKSTPPGGSILATPSQPPASSRTADERNTIEVFAKTGASCVFVTQRQVIVDYFAGRLHDVPAGSGSGFVWDRDGHVVTNFHVIAEAQTLTVTMHDQKTYQANVVGAEPRKDIAVLHIDAPAEALVPVPHYTGRFDVQVGEKVIAIGNPFGLDQTLTTGVVSALGRQVEGIGGVTIRQMIQTDAAINPGNSGGPLLDSSGHLIGMNTMIYSRSGASAGIGFAVPAQTISRVVSQLIKYGKVKQVGIGIEIDPSQRIERRLGIQGVVVIDVLPNGPAAKAGVHGLSQGPSGLRLGDTIVAIDGKSIKDYDDLYNTLDGRRPGETVKVALLRDNRKVTLDLKLVPIQ